VVVGFLNLCATIWFWTFCLCGFALDILIVAIGFFFFFFEIIEFWVWDYGCKDCGRHAS
jgi:hypothetical protein